MPDEVPEKVRQFCYQRDNYRCRWCGVTNAYRFHLHHIKYRSEGGPHVPENLITLCEAHHNLAHSNKRIYQPILLELLEEKRAITGAQLMRWRS